MAKKIAIIGAGVSGLTAGIYALKAGFRAEIFERFTAPGGEMTGWDREDFHIDGCIHWLTGTADDPADAFNDMWKTVGMLGEGVEILKPETFGTFEHDGETFSFTRDVGETGSRMLEISEKDAPAIGAFVNEVKDFPYFSAPAVAVDCMSLSEKMKLLKTAGPALKAMKRLGKIPAAQFAERFTHPLLRFAFKTWGADNASVGDFIYSYAVFCRGKTGVPAGGSRAAAERIAEKFLSMGGLIQYGAPVAKLPVVGKTASLILADERWLNADYIVPACDIHATFGMLHEQYRDKRIEERDAAPAVYPLWASFLLSYAVDDKMENIPKELTFKTQLAMADAPVSYLSYTAYADQPAFAPEGKNIMQVQVPTNYEFWDKLYADKKEYAETKTRYGQEVLERVEERVPALKGKLRLIDAATPKTWERYTGAHKGSWMSWGAALGAKPMIHDGRVAGIDNLYMAGQWLMPPGGLPAAITGKWAVQRIMRKEKRDYRGL